MAETNSNETDVSEPERATNKTALFLVFLTVFIDLLGFAIVLPLLPRYGREFGATGPAIGMLFSCFSLFQFLLAPIWGRVSDHVGRRPILLMGLAGSCLSYALFGYATSLGAEGSWLGLSAFGWLFVSRSAAGIFGATIPTAQAYIADVTTPEQRSRGMALIGAAFGAGFTFGPLIGAAFVRGSDSDAPSAMPGYVAAVLSGIAFVFALARLPESRRAGADPGEGHRSWFDLASLRTAVARPFIGLTMLAMFLSIVAFAQFETTLARLTGLFGMDDRKNFLVFAYVGFVLALGQGVIVRRFLPKLGEYRMALLGTFVTAVGLAVIGLLTDSRSNAALFAVLPIAVLGFSAMTPSLQAMLSLRTSESDQGGVLGLGQSVSAIARIIGPMVGLTLFDEVGAASPYWCGAALMLVAVAMVATLRTSDSTTEDRDEQNADRPQAVER